MDVQGQAPTQYVTLPVAQLAQAVSELQVTPGVTYGPPAPEPGITNLTVVSRYTASTPTDDSSELVISWDGGPQNGVLQPTEGVIRCRSRTRPAYRSVADAEQANHYRTDLQPVATRLRN